MPTDYSAPASVPVSQPAAGPRAPELPVAKNPYFLLKHHPLRWQWYADGGPDGGGEWLPMLSTRQWDLGVGGVDKNGDTSYAEIEERRTGWAVIPPNTTPDGGSYVLATPCRGGQYHHTRWETPRTMAGRMLSPVSDQDGYRAWLRWLVAEGHVPAMTEAAHEILVGFQRNRVAEASARVRTDADKDSADKAAQSLVAAEAAAPEAPKPSRRKAS